MIKKMAIFAAVAGSVLAVYWLSGGDFERDAWLGAATAIALWLGAGAVEELG